jgi:hypothetical protein
VIPYQDKRIREPEGSQTCRQGDLRGFVDDAVIEPAANEEWTMRAHVCKQVACLVWSTHSLIDRKTGRGHDLRAHESVLELGERGRIRESFQREVTDVGMNLRCDKDEPGEHHWMELQASTKDTFSMFPKRRIL